MLSFEPVAINCFRIGGGWDNTNSRVPLCATAPGNTVTGVQLVAEPPAEECDQDDVDGFESVMSDEFARSLFMFKLSDAGYDEVDTTTDGKLTINLWSEEAPTTGKSA